MSETNIISAKQVRIEELYQLCLEAAESAFDPKRNLIAQPAADNPDVMTYWGAGALPYAHALLSQDDVEAVHTGASIVLAMMESQVTNPHHPHQGNWKWLADDPEAGDLNAIQFVLRWFLPLLVNYSDKLPADVLEKCKDSIRMALGEEERMDVAPTFSNIHIGSLFALLVGAEWLGDEHFLAVGKARWERWVNFTLSNGAPHEYNSPDYGGWQLSALASIIQYVKDPTIRLQAQLMAERLWLHLALHIHQPTGQVAGPHSRSYWYTMTAGRGMTRDTFWLQTGWQWLLEVGGYGGSDDLPVSFMNLGLALVEQEIPRYLNSWFTYQQNALPYEVRETANRQEYSDITTYHSPSYALGTASKTYAIGTDCFYIEHEANYLMLHYKKSEDVGKWGMMYSRYVVNDRHWGTMGPAPDRPKEGNFYDHGNFAGIQYQNKAIGLYALMPEQEEVASLKTVIAFQSGDALNQIWINDNPVDLSESGQTLEHGDWLIIEDGDVYIGVFPLEQTVLSQSAPIRLERGPLGELWLSIYNYEGAPIRFWDYASLKGAFWRGNLRAGFVVEVAEYHEYASASDFLEHLKQAQVADAVDDKHIRTVTYHNGDMPMTLRYDLWNTCPVERLFGGQVYESPQLQSPLAVQGDTGYLEVGQARLYTQPQPIVLIAQDVDSSQQTFVAINPIDQCTHLRLETPIGTIFADEWGLGRIELHISADGNAVLRISCLQPPVNLSLPDGVTLEANE